MAVDQKDDWIPEFFTTGKLEPSSVADPAKEAAEALNAHWPKISIKRQQKFDRARAHADREEAKQGRKAYIKLSKKAQMHSILDSLELTFPAMRDIERDFCERLLLKFRKYGVVKAKWITEKQYQWVKRLGSEYLILPKSSAIAENPNERGFMPPISDIYDRKGIEEGMLHGSDIPEPQKRCEILVDFVREPKSKAFNAIAIIDFQKPVHGKMRWAVNKTNMDILLQKFGLTIKNELGDLERKIAGKKLTLKIVMVNNPQLGEEVRGLQVV